MGGSRVEIDFAIVMIKGIVTEKVSEIVTEQKLLGAKVIRGVRLKNGSVRIETGRNVTR